MASEEQSAQVGDNAPLDETVEAIQAVVRAAIDVGHQILDAVEQALDDPAIAQKLSEVAAGFASMAADVQEALTGRGGGPSRPTPPEVEHIEVS